AMEELVNETTKGGRKRITFYYINMSTLKIITWNVRGLQSERLRKKKVLFLQKLDYDILCLQELRLKTNEDIGELNKLWGPSHSVISIGEDSADGVGFFFKNTHVNIIKKRDIIPGQLLLVDCHYDGQKFRLINVYTAPERTKKMQLLKKMRHLLECGFNTVLCGDFNMVTEENDRIASTTFKESREGKLLTQICKDASLRDLYRILNPQTTLYKKVLQLKKLTTSDIQLWEILKERMRNFFKFKCREINYAKNMKYNEQVNQYIYLKNKKN
uniref:exodeoxyribonuclease III n=1 Tax=Oreochromis aureus TaxID=47969 RepID=A0A668TGV0_OREAU